MPPKGYFYHLGAIFEILYKDKIWTASDDFGGRNFRGKFYDFFLFYWKNKLPSPTRFWKISHFAISEASSEKQFRQIKYGCRIFLPPKQYNLEREKKCRMQYW